MKSLLNCTVAGVLGAAAILSSAHRAAGQDAPRMPAAPLAGGAAALGGNSYVDAYGNPIVMPASYGQPCMGYGECPMGGGGDGSAAYADFGAYGPDQCGPYYFDVAASAVFLQGEHLFRDVPPLGSVGVVGPTIIDPKNDFNDYSPGWQIALRHDLGPLSVLEATYMGVYDLGFKDHRVSETETARFGQPVLPFQLFTVFSGYGISPIAGLDEAEILDTNYQSDLQSTELSYRRYWVGYDTRISGTYLAGFRYVRLTEDLNLDSIAAGGNGNLRWQDANDLCGGQIGGDAWLCLRQGLRVGVESKGGVYNNHYHFRHATAIPDPTITNVDFQTHGDQVAFVGDASVDIVADILPSFSIRAGYQAMYMTSLVTVGNNIFPNEFADMTGNSGVLTQADATYHGFHAGLEYLW